MPEYDTIPGLSDELALPRVGKVRLGVRLKSQKGAEYPSEVPYFVVKEEVEKTEDGGVKVVTSAAMAKKFHDVYGDKPTEIDVLFLVGDRRVAFPQAFKKYRAGLARPECIGDGRTFRRVQKDGTIAEGECPGPAGCPFAWNDAKKRCECKLVGNLVFQLPLVTLAGVWQIDTSSGTSIRSVNSGLAYVQAVAQGFAGVPLKLRRVQRDITYEGKKSRHWTLELRLPDKAEDMQRVITGVVALRKYLAPYRVLALAGPSGRDEELYPPSTRRALPHVAPEPLTRVVIDAPAAPPPENVDAETGEVVDGGNAETGPEATDAPPGDVVADGEPPLDYDKLGFPPGHPEHLPPEEVPPSPPPPVFPGRGPGRSRQSVARDPARAAGEAVAKVVEARREAAKAPPASPPPATNPKPPEAPGNPLSLF